MKIRFVLVMFYQDFEPSKRGFILLREIQDSGERNNLSIQSHLHKNKLGLLCL